MNIIRISEPPSPSLAHALAEFEEPFTYPLGPTRFFRISHGTDYTLFFRAQGDAACFVAQQQGRVIGVLGTALRRLQMPNGRECTTAYLGDLKIAPSSRGGLVLARLSQVAEAWLRPKTDSAFGVVMGGTARTPESYSGRAGVPHFREAARVVIFRIIVAGEGGEPDAPRYQTDSKTCLDCYRRLSLGRFACPTGGREPRSEMPPVWLMRPDESACGMVEDTRKAKRLIAGEGSEMLSAHLSCFAYRTAGAGADLIKVALRHASAAGLPALFVAAAESDSHELRAHLGTLHALPAPAIVYATGLSGSSWNINTSEI